MNRGVEYWVRQLMYTSIFYTTTTRGSVTEYDDFEFVIQGEEWSEDLPYSKAIAIVDCDEDDYEFFNYLIKNRLTLSI